MGADSIFQVQQDQVIALAARHKVPAIYEWPEFVKAGGLVTYCVDSMRRFPPAGHIRKPHPERRQACRASGHADEQIRAGRQPEDRQGAWIKNTRNPFFDLPTR